MFYANSSFLHYSDAANCRTLLQCVLSQREHSSCSHWGLLGWEYNTSECYGQSMGKGHDYLNMLTEFIVAYNCLLKATEMEDVSWKQWFNSDCFPRSREGEQFLPSFLHQNLQCPLLARFCTGPWEQISARALPVTCSWLQGEADLAWGCRTK